MVEGEVGGAYCELHRLLKQKSSRTHSRARPHETPRIVFFVFSIDTQS